MKSTPRKETLKMSLTYRAGIRAQAAAFKRVELSLRPLKTRETAHVELHPQDSQFAIVRRVRAMPNQLNCDCEQHIIDSAGVIRN